MLEIYCSTYYNIGNGDYDSKKFKTPKTKDEDGKVVRTAMSKPYEGGLWSSPVKSNYGWVDFCKGELYSDDFTGFSFNIDKNARVFVIDSLNDFKRLPSVLPDWCKKETLFENKLAYYILDFDKIAKKYDAVYLTLRGESETRYETTMYGWDCETLLVLNKDIIKNVKNFKIE